jgi:lipopolysaccharide transport system ATP-binding protein
MQTDTLIKVNNVSKKFCKEFKQSLWYGLTDLFLEFFGKKRTQQLRKKEFWAVKNVSFELKRGQCLGLIGHNGAGKSTLLKMLNGLIKPDEGQIEMYGKVGALIELGAGFNPILTGRENIFINGAVLGFTKKEINNKLNDIIEFSEIGEFIDMPVQSYSSGMKVRLGFAVASQLEPDILIIDEVLAVGDIAFRTKCYNKISQLLHKTTVIFVSHSMTQISRISNTLLLLEKGLTKYIGNNIDLGLTYYLSISNENTCNNLSNKNVEIFNFKINNIEANNEISIKHNKKVTFNFKLDLKYKSQNLWITLLISDSEQKGVAILFTEYLGSVYRIKDFEFYLENNNLTNGKYFISVNIIDVKTKNQRNILAKFQNVTSFIVNNSPINSSTPIQYQLKNIVNA